MRLHCLGTVGYHPNRARHTSCYFLPESGIVLDAGSGAFRLGELVETDHLDILISHAHLDHTFGLTFLLDVLYQVEKRRGRPLEKLRIHGEANKLAAIQSHVFNELIFPVALDADWIAIDDRPTFSIGEVDVAWRAQDHPGGSVAYRLDWKPLGKRPAKRLVYATDTTGDTTAQHSEWSAGADVLMHECYFRDAAADWAVKTGHSYAGRVAEVASLSRPKHLLLTHINPIEEAEDAVGMESIRKKVACTVTLATDEMTLDF
ncbi:MBL fold metallo-hydrolase [Rubripirellula reticaptiva]|uniref:Ribonuclease Z n=1 Tax=Rubripirellula reticaptiva TaxID=2528013 RepID=A0A5C6EI87_9BACT|nr:MBL fold metallo-hydrolase [Rubripirellula reticaptiva]TWU47777.1 ribonuclease Z [Rubripirellula reticaptiva]